MKSGSQPTVPIPRPPSPAPDEAGPFPYRFFFGPEHAHLGIRSQKLLSRGSKALVSLRRLSEE